MRRLATWFAALMAALVILPLAAQPAHAEEEGQEPLARFGACVRGGGQGSVLMLFDKSGSLKATDPEAARVTSSKYLVKQLASTLSSQPDAKVQIALAGFDHSYERTLDWTDLNESNLDTINADLDAYAERKEGLETDYWKAVDGARQELAARQSAEANGCAMVVWFSDGGFAIGHRPNENAIREWGGPKPYDPDNKLEDRAAADAARDAGEEDMCRPGGVADQLRSMDIVTIGIGLAVDTSHESFDLMKGFTSAEGAPCGDIKDPKPGEFRMATDVDELLLAFDQVLNEGGEKPVDTGLCVEGQEPCSEGTRVFVLDGSIGKVQGLAQVPVDGARIHVKTRDGELVELTRDKQSEKVPGATLNWEWLSERTLTVELVRDGQSPEWIGPWGLVFVAPTATDELAKSTLRIYGDIAPHLTNRDDLQIRTGADPVELKLALRDGKGNEIDPSTLSDETFLNVSLLGADGATHKLGEGIKPADIAKPITLDPKDLPPGAANVWMGLEVTTQSWEGDGQRVPGTKLEPITTMVPIAVLPPEDFPTMPSKVSFGETEKADPVTVTVPLEGKGCVWLGDKTQFTGYPKGLDSATLTSPAKDEASCSDSGLELTLDPSGVGNGALVGTTEVFLKSPSAAEGVPVTLDFDLQMSKPASQPVLWGTLIGVTLLGIAIPVGILYLTKHLTAKIPGDAVLATQVSGPVDDTRSFTDNGLNVDIARMQIAHLTNNRRRVDVAGVTLQSKMGLALTEPGYVAVEQPGKAAGGRTTMSSVGDKAKLPLGVQGNWTVALDPDRPQSGDVRVTVFTGPGAPGLGELLDDVRANIRDAVAKLREGLPPEPAGPSNDPWGGGPSGGGQPDPWANPPSAPQANPWNTPPAPAGNPGGWGTQPTPPRPQTQPTPPPSAPRPPMPPGAPGQWQNPPNNGWGGSPSSGGAGW